MTRAAVRSFARWYRTRGVHHRLHVGRVRGVEAVDECAVNRRVPRVQRFTIAGFARVDGRGRFGKTDKRDAPAPEAEQMLGDDVAGTPVVDADQIMMAALRIRDHRPVEQDDWNARLVQRVRDPPVHVVLLIGQFERRQEHAGDLTLDTDGITATRSSFERGTARASPQQGAHAQAARPLP